MTAESESRPDVFISYSEGHKDRVRAELEETTREDA